MQTHETPSFQPAASSLKNNLPAPRPFKDTHSGQELDSLSTNPFPPRPHEVWMGEPRGGSTNPFPRRPHEVDMGEPKIARKPISPPVQAEATLDPEANPFIFGNRPFRMNPPDAPPPPPRRWGIQAKVAIGQPNDVYEQEADRVAEQVMGMSSAATPTVQRQVEEEELEELQTKPLAETITPLVQRQEVNLPPVPNYQLTPPSLVTPPSASTPYQLGGQYPFRLNRQMQLTALQYTQQQLTPTILTPLLSQLSLDALSLTPPVGSPGAAGAAPSPTTPPAAAPAPAPAPPSPATADAKPEAPRSATPGDVLKAVLAMPAINTAITQLQSQTEQRFRSDWKRLRVGEQVGVVSSLAVLGSGAIAGIISSPDARQLVLGQLNGKVLPVPGTNWLRAELNTGSDSLMMGLHLDVGALLPSILGFGPGSSSAIGGPPQPQPYIPGVQRAATSGAAPNPQHDLESRLNQSQGRGSALPDEVRSFMEPRFGADFSQVRVHTGSEAVQMNRDLNAQAFTHRQDVYFGAGKSPAKDALTAHELTHTIQQTGVQLVQLQSKPDQFDTLIQNGDWHSAAWTLAKRDPQEITAKISSMPSMKRIYLVEGARHGEGKWNIDAIISPTDKISHRDTVIGSVRFFVWKHRWGEAGTYLCGLSDEDMRQVAISLELTIRDMQVMADEQTTKPQKERINVVLLGNLNVVRQAPKDLIGNDGEKKAEFWLLGDPLVGQYAKKKFDAGIVVTGHLHIIPSVKWTDTYVKHNLGRRNPDTGEIITEKNAGELRVQAVVVGGFCEDHKEIYIEQNEASPGTVLHEAIHLIAEDTFKEVYGSAVNEGTTEYFARLIARRAGLHPNRSYLEQHDGVAALAHLVGDDTLARAFFTGKVLLMQQAVEDIKGPGIFRQWREAMRDDSQRKNASNILNSAPNISK